MAEVLINSMGEGQYKAVSAGSSPAGYVHPRTIETLERHGLKAGEPRSKSWDEFSNHSFDLVITVCDQAASESCPVLLGNYETKHWSIPDPATVEGTGDQIQQAFDVAFDMLKDRIEKELL